MHLPGTLDENKVVIGTQVRINGILVEVSIIPDQTLMKRHLFQHDLPESTLLRRGTITRHISFIPPEGKRVLEAEGKVPAPYGEWQRSTQFYRTFY